MDTPAKASQSKLTPGNILGFILSFVKGIFTSTQNIIGIDIGSSYIKIVQLQKARKGHLITNCITRAIPQTAKDNPEEKRKLILEFVKQFIADARIKTNLGRLAICGKGVFVLSLNVPYLNKKDLRGAVSIDLKKRLPFQADINSVSFDFFVIGQSKDEKGSATLQVTCIAADRVMVDEQVRFLKEMNIRPVGINVVPDVLGNLLPFCLEGIQQKTIALLDIGANTSLLNFYKGKELIFSREIPIAGEHLTRSMVKTVTNPTGAINISFEEAEKIKRSCGIPMEEEAKTEYFTDFGALRGEQISTMLRPTLERLIMEISRTFSYYVSTFKARPIEELYITGGSSRLKNIEKFLLANLQGVRKVEKLNVLKTVKGWADTGVLKQEMVMEQAAPHLSAAFGLCLGGGGKINLLPVKEKLEQKAFFLTTLVRILFPILLGLSLSLYAATYFNSMRYKTLISNLDRDISRLEPTAASVREFMGIKMKLEQRKDILEKAKGRQPMWWGVFKELSNITPKEVVLDRIITLEVKEPKKIKLMGKIFAKYTIVDLALQQYIVSLDDSPFFSRVELTGTKTDMYSAIPAANFEIICTLSY